MILVEFTLHHPALRETRRAAPSTRLVWEQSHRQDDGEHRVTLWAEGSGLEDFEELLAGDSSVRAFRTEVETAQRRLYQITLTDAVADASVYPALVEEASIIQRLVGDDEGWHLRVAFPDRDSLDSFRAFCEEHDISYEVSRIYEERGGTDADRGFGLTEKQRELLEMATRRGYFDVPRDIGLEELAAEAGISHQAASERLRRAQATLNRRALGFSGDEESSS